MASKRVRKVEYAERLKVLLAEYKNILVCEIDFVGSNQMQQIRIALRGRAIVLMGKNTIIRKVVRDLATTNQKMAALLPLIAGNVGFVFTNEELSPIRAVIQANKVPAAAKTGTLAPNAVVVPAGPTGLDPGQTSFFQALEISTKIMRGSIEILDDVQLVKEGEKVTASHVGLLAKLNIKPFSYGMKVATVYEDGFVYSAKVLDMSQADLLNIWYNGVRRVAALSRELGFPNIASIPFAIRSAFRKLIAITFVTKYSFKEAEELKKHIASGGGAAAAPAAAKKEEKKAAAAEPEAEEEDEEDFGGVGGLFGDGGDDEEEGDEEWDEEEGDEEEEE